MKVKIQILVRDQVLKCLWQKHLSPQKFLSHLQHQTKLQVKKRKIIRKKEEQFLETCSQAISKISNTKREIDEFDAIGIGWAAKVRKLTDVQKILDEDLINQTLKKAYFQELTKTTVIQDLHSSVPSSITPNFEFSQTTTQSNSNDTIIFTL
ncbi:unnamed protein product [Brassicogethes aeneus]|uniref:Uncharacterized protein n=1 Tax=Brassicogethes aeneus TaxID=1431903 RepID=A0A9P0B6M6_BRAAE|nr:unnamed protein product [Brassicogethes aeneus]